MVQQKLRIVVVGVCGLLLASAVLAALVAYAEYADLKPPRSLPQAPDGGAGASGAELAHLRAVTFQSDDGLTLHAWYVPPKNGALVLLAHGYGGNRAELLFEARVLARAGFGALLVDLRAHGESQGERTTYGQRESADLRRALDFVCQQPEVNATRLGALGFSIGGSAVALLSAEDSRVKAVVLEAPLISVRSATHDEMGRWAWFKVPPALLGMRLGGLDVDAFDVNQAAQRVSPRPLLLVHGALDHVVPKRRIQELFAVAKEPKQLLEFAQAGHGGYAEIDAARYEQTLLAFFNKWLLSSA